MNIFDLALRQGDLAVDATMGEEFDFRPMVARPDINPGQDPDRDQLYGVVACWEAPARAEGDSRFTRSTVQPRIRVLRDRLPQGIKQGDRFLRVKDGTVWEVMDFGPDSQDARLSLPVRLIRS